MLGEAEGRLLVRTERAGDVTLKVSWLEDPPPGEGFEMLTGTLRAFKRSSETRFTAMRVELMSVPVRVELPNCIEDVDMKFLP